MTPEIKKENGEEVRVFGIVSSGVTYHKGFKNALSYAFVGTYENSKTIFTCTNSYSCPSYYDKLIENKKECTSNCTK